jgi:hypothetical protein
MFTKSEAIHFIEKCFGEALLSNSGLNANVVCPFCKREKGINYSNKKLVIRTSDFALHCWRCGYKSRGLFGLLYKFRRSFLEEYKLNFENDLKREGLIKKFVATVESNEYREKILSYNKEPTKEKTNVLPVGFRLLNSQPYGKREKLIFDEALKYLFNRKITEQQIVDNNLGVVSWFETTQEFVKFNNRIMIPSFDRDALASFYTTRTILKDVLPRYSNSGHSNEIVFNSFFINSSLKELTLVEGPFDYICSPYENTIPLLGSSISKQSLIYQFIYEFKPKLLRIVLDKNELIKANKVATELYLTCEPETTILIGNINHPVAKDFAEIQDLSNRLAEPSDVSETIWHPLSIKDKLLLKVQNR